jgi:hypothetical protein
MKRIANRRVRLSHGVPNGGGFKKVYNSYNIRDWMRTGYRPIDVSDSIRFQGYNAVNYSERYVYKIMNK